MPAHLKRVVRGEVSPKLASRENTLVNVHGDTLDRMRDTLPQQRNVFVHGGGEVLVENTTGEHLDQYSVVYLVDSGLGLRNDEYRELSVDIFKSKRFLLAEGPSGPEPKDIRRLAITQVALPAGRIGRACVVGVTQVLLKVEDEEHNFASPEAYGQRWLVTGPAGLIPILWKEPGTGERWGIVKIGHAFVGDRYAKAQSDWEANGTYGGGNPRVQCKLCDWDGSNEQGDDFWVYCPRDRKGTVGWSPGADPSIYAEDVIRWSYDEDGKTICVSEYLHMGRIGDIIMYAPILYMNPTAPKGWHVCDGKTDLDSPNYPGGKFTVCNFASEYGPVGGPYGFYVGAIPRHAVSGEQVGVRCERMPFFDWAGAVPNVVFVGHDGDAQTNDGDHLTHFASLEYPTVPVLFYQRYA